jgi:hypothetical protein
VLASFRWDESEVSVGDAGHVHIWSWLTAFRLQVSTVLVLGGLFIGDLNTPYRSNATIRLFGDRTASGLVYNGMDFGSKVGNHPRIGRNPPHAPLPSQCPCQQRRSQHLLPLVFQVVAVFGTLRMCGIPHLRTWTRLYATAFPGDTVVLVRGFLTWAVGDEVILTSSTFEPQDTDTAVLLSNVWLTEGVTQLVLDRPLVHIHVAEQVSNLSIWYRVEAEIGLLTRTITVESGDEADEAFLVHDGNITSLYNLSEAEQYGARVHVVAGVLPDLSQDYFANVTMQYVQLQRSGQAGFSRRDGVEVGAPGYLRPLRDYPPIVIEGCLFRNGFHSAVGVYESIKDTRIVKNIVLNTTWAGFRVHWYQPLQGRPEPAHVLDDNLVINLRVPPAWRVTSNNNSGVWNVSLGQTGFSVPAGFQLEPSGLASARGNSVAGSEFAGFVVEPESCANVVATVQESTAHACSVGFSIARVKSGRALPTCALVG